MTLHRTPNGGFVPLGRVEQRVAFSPAFTSALPSWLAAQTGTATVRTANYGSAPAHIEVAAAAAGGAYRLWCTNEIIPSQYEELEATLHGLRFDSDAGWYVLAGFGGTANDRGVILYHGDSGTTESTAVIREYVDASTARDTATGYQLQKPYGGSRRPRNITLLWRTRAREFFVLEDDQVMAKAPVSADVSTGTPVRFMFTVGATDGGTHYMRTGGVEVALRHN